MTDGLDLSALLSALGGSGGASGLSGASGNGDLASKLTSVLGGSGDPGSKLSSALGGDAGANLADALKNVDLSALLSTLNASQDAAGSPVDEKQGSDGIASALPSVVAALTRGGDERSKQRRALLSAIRPFVSDRRKRAIDALVGIEKLTAVLPGVK